LGNAHAGELGRPGNGKSSRSIVLPTRAWTQFLPRCPQGEAVTWRLKGGDLGFAHVIMRKKNPNLPEQISFPVIFKKFRQSQNEIGVRSVRPGATMSEGDRRFYSDREEGGSGSPLDRTGPRSREGRAKRMPFRGYMENRGLKRSLLLQFKRGDRLVKTRVKNRDTKSNHEGIFMGGIQLSQARELPTSRNRFRQITNC